MQNRYDVFPQCFPLNAIGSSLLMAPTEVVTSTACSCNCEKGNRIELRKEDVHEEDDWQHCECTFCGPVLEDGSRRCKVKVSPLLKLITAIDSGVPMSSALPAVCGDCRHHCRRVRRLEAVVAAREAGKHDQGQAMAQVARPL